MFARRKGGGLTIDHNIVYISPERGLKHCTLLKFDCPWRRDYGVPSRGITFVHHHEANGAAPDLGAIELGDAWEFPRPGPLWALGKNRPWRPALPPSVHPSWVGLAD